MSLAIECDDVDTVMLADGWYQVLKNSFGIDSYEFMWGETCLHGGGDSGISSSGFHFYGFKIGHEGTKISMYGPLTSVVAIGTKASKKKVLKRGDKDWID